MNKSGSCLPVLLLMVLCTAFFTGCAATHVETKMTLPFRLERSSQADQKHDSAPKEKIVAAVLPLGLSERAARNYPHLLEQSVGMGIHNRVVEALYDCGRFRFVEEKPEIVKDVLDRQWLSSSGMVDQTEAVRMGRILGAKKVIYGEVFDYARGGEKIMGLKAQKGHLVRMGVQVRCVDVETLEYVPGTGSGDGTDDGQAADNAVSEAVDALLERMD